MIIDFSELDQIRTQHPGQKIVFAGGCFDITHAGHVLFLEESKKYGDVLVVEVATDNRIRRNKGPSRPVFNEHMRIKIIDSLKSVDYTYLEPFLAHETHPLEIKDATLEKLKPDVYIITEDSLDAPYLKKISEKHSTKLVVLTRTCPPEFESISTSKIIKKVLGEADKPAPEKNRGDYFGPV